MYIKKYGNIIELANQGDYEVIVHGCNCFHTMGAGLAKQMADAFPECLYADKKTPYGDINKLGTYSSTVVRNKLGGTFTIVNAYTQFRYGYGVHVDYDAIKKVFTLIARDFHGKIIGYPKIGAGLAGGDWDKIKRIIDDCLFNEYHQLVIYKP